MHKSKIPSPSRSQGALLTPRRNPSRRTRSVGSPARSTASGCLSTIVDQFKDSNRQSVALSPLDKTFLSDNTDIEMPRRKSWWKNVDHSRDLVAVLDNDDPADAVNVLEELDLELLSQEKKATQNYTLDLPESSGSESISSIVLPQRRLFTQKENVPQGKKFGQIVSSRESITKHNKSREDKLPMAGSKTLFGDAKRTKPDFPAALITLSPDKTLANKTKDLAVDIQVPGKSLFGNRPGVKRKNMFADFIVSESEDEIPEIQCKKFAFPKSNKAQPIRQSSVNSRAIREPSPTTSITTEMELDDWKLLPSSTMVDHQIQIHLNSPGRRSLRLSKLSEAKESTNADTSRRSSKPLNKNKDVEKEEEESPKKIEKYQTEIVEKNQEDDDESRKILANANSSKQSNKSINVNEDKEKVEEKTPKHIEKSQNVTIEENEDNNESQMKLSKVVSNSQSNKSVNKNVDKKKAEENTPEKIENSPNKIVKINQGSECQEEKNNREKNVPATYESNKKEEEEGSQRKLEVNNIEKDIGLCPEIVETDDQEDEVKKCQEEEVEERQEDVEVDRREEKDVEVSHEEAEADDQEDVEVDHEKKDEDDLADVEMNHEEAESDNEEIENEVDTDNLEEDAEESQEEVELDHQEEDGEESQKEVELDHQEEDDEGYIDKTEYSNNDTDDEGEQSDNKELAEDSRQEEEAVEIEDRNIIQEKESSVQNMNASTQMDEEDNVKLQEENSVCDEVDVFGNKESLNELIDDSQECNEQNESEDARGQDESEDSENEGAEDDQDKINEMEINDTQDDGADCQKDDQNQNGYENEVQDQNDAEISHDTTGRNRKKHDTKSPEAILKDVSNDANSFTAKGRNTSIRNTKSVMKNFTFRPSMAPARESTGLGDGTKNSSAEGSGWDSHRTTRKTMRQTFGRDFSPRKSLRALVMEKSAKRQTAIHEANAGLKLHQANSTEIPVENSGIDYDDHEEPVESDHEMSRRTRQTTLENYLQKIKKENIERKQRIEEQVRNSLKSNQVRADVLNFKVPSKPAIKRAALKQPSSKVKRMKPLIIARENLPPELLEDLKYKPPKRFRPSNASWITSRLYNFLERKLEPKYDYKARVRAEKLVEMIYNFARDACRLQTAPPHAVNELKKEMARLEIVQTHFEFYNFFNEYMPLEIKIKVVPDIINNIPVPREGVFAPILM